jgi:hypothetical protein
LQPCRASGNDGRESIQRLPRLKKPVDHVKETVKAWSLYVPILLAALALFGGCKKTGGVATRGTNADLVVGSGAPAAPSSSSLSMQVAWGNFEKANKRVAQLLKSVTDDASARAAAPKLGPAGGELGEAMKLLKVTVAALETTGRKAEVDKFYQDLAMKTAAKEAGGEAEFELEAEIERVALGPHGPLLRPGINTMLDAMLDGATIRQRAKWEEWIQKKGLRG